MARILFGLTALAVCTAPAQAAHYRDVRIKGVPHIRQKPDFCGEACASMFLRALGFDADQDLVFDHTGLDPALGRGAYTRDLARALRDLGFEVGPVWHAVPAADAEAQLERLWGELHADLLRGVPSIVCMHFDERPDTTEHFRLVLGYEARSDSVIYHEPAEANGAYRHMPRRAFLKLWPLKYRADAWTVIRLPLRPGAQKPALKPTGSLAARTPADYAQHVMALKAKVPAGFTIVVQAPFVVIGDEAPEIVRRRAVKTVKWSIDRLKAAYFDRDPKEIIDVWLFKDARSYRRHTQAIFNETPSTPYGYYSSSDHALIMNIATGGGTLVHEIVHPFMEASFPEAPAWLNEGLGSLYEQSAQREGGIWGLTNWRLAGLQTSLRAGDVPTFAQLTGTGGYAFYEEDPGTNYAQARYLLYFLQEKGLLRRFYQEFHAHHATDPTGYQTLRRVLGNPDMAAFQARWARYVLGLRFDG